MRESYRSFLNYKYEWWYLHTVTRFFLPHVMSLTFKKQCKDVIVLRAEVHFGKGGENLCCYKCIHGTLQYFRYDLQADGNHFVVSYSTVS